MSTIAEGQIKIWLSGFADAVTNIKTLTSAFAGLAIIGALKSSISEANIQLEANAETLQRLSYNMDLTDYQARLLTESMRTYSGQLQFNSRLTDEQLQTMSGMLGKYVENEDQLKRLTSAMNDYITISKVPFTSAVKSLESAFDGQRGALSDYVSEGAGAETMIRQLTDAFGGYAQRLNDFTHTEAQDAQKAIDEFKEGFGLGVLQMQSLELALESVSNTAEDRGQSISDTVADWTSGSLNSMVVLGNYMAGDFIMCLEVATTGVLQIFRFTVHNFESLSTFYIAEYANFLRIIIDWTATLINKIPVNAITEKAIPGLKDLQASILEMAKISNETYNSMNNDIHSFSNSLDNINAQILGTMEGWRFSFYSTSEALLNLTDIDANINRLQGLISTIHQRGREALDNVLTGGEDDDEDTLSRYSGFSSFEDAKEAGLRFGRDIMGEVFKGFKLAQSEQKAGGQLLFMGDFKESFRAELGNISKLLSNPEDTDAGFSWNEGGRDAMGQIMAGMIEELKAQEGNLGSAFVNVINLIVSMLLSSHGMGWLAPVVGAVLKPGASPGAGNAGNNTYNQSRARSNFILKGY